MLTRESSCLGLQGPKQLLPLGPLHSLEGPRGSTAQNLRESHLGKPRRHTKVRDLSKNSAVARFWKHVTACLRIAALDACMCTASVQRRSRGAPMRAKRRQGLRLSRVAVIVLGCHSLVRHRRRSRSPKTKRKNLENNSRNPKLECGRLCDRTFFRPPRLLSAACGWRLRTVAVWRRLHAPTDKETAARRPERRMLSSRCATRTGERFWILCKVFYRENCLQFVGMLLCKCNSHAFSAAFLMPSQNGEPSEVSSALPEQRNEAGVFFHGSGTRSSSRRPSLADVSVANAVEKSSCAV